MSLCRPAEAYPYVWFVWQEDVDKLKAVHCTEAQELLSKHLATTTRDTAPIVVGSYQIRMPPMVGRGDIAIPFLFLEQVSRRENREKTTR